MKMYGYLLLLIILLCCGPKILAQQQNFAVEAASSQVNMTLGANDHATHGTFHIRSGSIGFDRSTQKMSGTIVVAAGSGKTGNDSRDKKMTNEVLEAAKFAEVSFAPTAFQGTLALTGDSTIQVMGTFTLHGTSHELTIPMQVHIDGLQCTAKASFVVPYVKWGLKDPSIFILKVAKEVDIDLMLSGRLSS